MRAAYQAHVEGFLEACDLAPAKPVVEAKESPGLSDKRPWLAYVDGEVLRASSGVGRRFKSKEAAERAGRIWSTRGRR